ncbi:aspartyl-phosphate phosphatase Spo0E family protein [Sediminibacillus massiliensis]|uniref:aspartyl-phosphate phosphatase Spo0E family protein n=1 Tax=Sediminibacillus massiliensis TaxID=1926277 RepID=UPI0009883511|nr:aspartyl-phosphate phosphatase Spo0E family protein [Sediminibacillus massiliensis]
MEGPYADVDKKSLQEKIRDKRKQMIQVANLYGFTSLITVQHSQELDVLLNEYSRENLSSISSC